MKDPEYNKPRNFQPRNFPPRDQEPRRLPQNPQDQRSKPQEAYHADEQEHEHDGIQESYEADVEQERDPDIEYPPSEDDLEPQDAYFGTADLPPGPWEAGLQTTSSKVPVEAAALQPMRHQSGIKPTKCRICFEDMPSKAALFKHLRAKHLADIGTKPATNQTTLTWFANTESLPLIRSTAKPTPTPGYEFRNWRYLEILVALERLGEASRVCLDTGCRASLIDSQFLQAFSPDAEVKNLPTLEYIKGIGDKATPTTTFVTLDVFLHGKVRGRRAIGLITKEFRIVPVLQPKMLLGMDVIGPEDIMIDVGNRRAILIKMENLEVEISIRPRSEKPCQATVMVSTRTEIPPRSCKPVPVKFTKPLPAGRDYVFTPDREQISYLSAQGGSVYGHVLAKDTETILIRNDADHVIVAHEHLRLGKITECDIQGAYQIDSTHHGLAALNPEPRGPARGRVRRAGCWRANITWNSRVPSELPGRLDGLDDPFKGRLLAVVARRARSPAPA